MCGRCGTRPEEWKADPNIYVGWAERCMGCEVLEQETANLDPDASKGVRVMLRRNRPDLEHGG